MVDSGLRLSPRHVDVPGSVHRRRKNSILRLLCIAMNDQTSPMSSGPLLIANPYLEIRPLDSDSEEPMTVCEVPADDDRRRRYAVPESIAALIELFDGERSLSEAVREYEERHPGRHSHEKLESLVRGFLIPKGLVLPRGRATKAVPERTTASRPRSFLYIKLPLISHRVIEPIANLLKWAYLTPVLVAWIPLFIGLHVYFYASVLPQHDLNFNELNVGGILALMLISTIGTFVHELGHASAAAHYGCKRLEIGWGLYLVFTVLYTDVSEAWRLPRRQRALIDLGGIYFQSVFLAALLALFFMSRNEIYLFAFIFSDLTIASSLNPFLRLDGYWLMSDLFGILNLRQQSMEMLWAWAAKIFRSRELRSPSHLRLGRRARIALVIYSLAGIAFFVFLVKIIFDRVAVQLVVGYPESLADFFTDMGSGGSAIGIVGSLLEILWRTMMLAGFGFMLFTALSWAARMLKKALVAAGRLAPVAGGNRAA